MRRSDAFAQLASSWEAHKKQKAGKEKMRQFGKVEIPQEAFIATLKMED